MDWIEQLKIGGPLAIVLGSGLIAVSRAYLSKDKQLQDAQHARIGDLKDIAMRAGKDDDR